MHNVRRILSRKEKGHFLTVHLKDELYGEVYDKFYHKFSNELGPVWTLIDYYGNRHKVGFNQSLEYPLMTDDWNNLRAFYFLTGDHCVFLRYLGNSFFQITVFKAPSSSASFPLFHSRSTKGCRTEFFTVTLSGYKAKRSKLNLPKDFACLVRNTGFSTLYLSGPEGQTSCDLEVKDYPNKTTNIGMGWKQFCADNGFKKGDHLKFEFVNSNLNNIVNVTKITA